MGALSTRGYCQVQLLPGEVLPVLKDVGVGVSVQFSTEDVLAYSYTITNPGYNTGKVWSIDIDISRSSAAVDLGFEGLRRRQ